MLIFISVLIIIIAQLANLQLFSSNRRAKYYKLSKMGRQQLGAETEEWERISLAIGLALRAT